MCASVCGGIVGNDDSYLLLEAPREGVDGVEDGPSDDCAIKGDVIIVIEMMREDTQVDGRRKE